VDLRSDIAAESRAKIIYEYLMQFTDDPLVKETLGFLMTREIAHFQMFEAALEAIDPNCPPCVRNRRMIPSARVPNSPTFAVSKMRCSRTADSVRGTRGGKPNR
jgi:Mn-containing catalase